MLRVALKALLAQRVRYLLTAFAVLLGVAFMAGTFVLTDTINHTFDSLYTTIYANTAAVVRARQAFNPGISYQTQRPPIPAALVEAVRRVPGVREVSVGIEGYAQLVGANGKAIGNPASGPPTLGEAWPLAADMSPYRLLAGGRPPQGPGEVAIDQHSASVGKLTVGSRVLVLTKQPPRHYRVTGIVTWGSAASPLGASITLFDQTTAAEVVGQPGKVNEIDVAAAPGVSEPELASRLRRALDDPSLEVVTGTTVAAEGQDAVHQAMGVFDTFLLVFAVIALFVGSFLVFNTFSIIVAQRQRELALLRAIGASRRQLVASLLVEALVIGIAASIAGIAAGIGLAAALKALLGAIGVSLPATGIVVGERTLLVALCVGTAVTLAAAVLPARRAAAAPPIAALQAVDLEPDDDATHRGAIGGALVGAGALALGIGLFASIANRVALVGIGGAVLFVGVAVLAPLVARPVSAALGAPIARRSPMGRLARQNAMRNPRRTAHTASALMVGIALVSVMAVFAASIRASVSSILDAAMQADYVISPASANSMATGFSPHLEAAVASLPEVAAATGIRAGTVKIAGRTMAVLAADPTKVDDLFDVGVVAGTIGSLGANDLAISEQVADSRHLALGSAVPVVFPATGRKVFTVRAIYRDRQVAGDYVLPLAAARSNFVEQLDYQVYVKLRPGVSATAGRQAIEHVLAGYPTATLMDQAQYKAQQATQIDQALGLVNALLSLAIAIAVIGIANTLALSVHERIREIGLLRAVGMTKRQVRTTIRYESVLIALFGALLGLAVGLALGVALVTAMRTSGVTRLEIPIAPIVEVVVVALLAGVVASLSPARRAARLNVLEAIAAE